MCDAATPGPWKINRFDQDGGSINWQVQSGVKPYEVIANVDDEEPRRARHDAALICAARERLPVYIDALADIDRRIAEMLGEAERAAKGASVDAAWSMGPRTEYEIRIEAKVGVLREVVRVLRGEK